MGFTYGLTFSFVTFSFKTFAKGYGGTMKNLLLDIVGFLVAVLRWWKVLVTGSLATACIVAYEHLKGQQFGTATSAILFGGFVLAAIFLAWREERVRVRALEPLPLVPGVDIEHYDPVLRPDQAWSLRIRDRNNPDLVVNIQIVRSRLFVGIQNRHGRDQSANLRPIRIELP